jgi:Rrf2 family protein
MAANSRLAVGLHALTVLAFRAPEVLRSDEIALSVRTNPVVIRRILARLTRAGLVKSIRGKAGGFALRRDPRRITALDVYQALEPSGLFAQHAQEPDPHCQVSCAMKNLLAEVFEDADEAVAQQLSRITIASLASQV